MRNKSKDRYPAITIWCKNQDLPLPVLECMPFGKEERKRALIYGIELRAWRLDYAWPDLRIGVEIDGGAWISGRHNRGSGYIAGMKRRNAMVEAGWLILYYPPSDIDFCQLSRVVIARLLKSGGK